MFSALAQSPETTSNAEASAAIIMRPKTRERGAQRETYSNESARYMNDFRPAHERNNTLLSMFENTKNDGWVTVTSRKFAGARKRNETSVQTKKESFPELPQPQTYVKPLCWVSKSSGSNEHMKPKDEFKLAPVPESAKVKNKTVSFVTLNKSTMNDSIDEMNFKEREIKLQQEVTKWKDIAENRALLLDEMETKINYLNKELDDMYDRYC